ncbi:uncharacterized protein LOC142328997 isoform X2 [Lycorma delicatula]|uniref:uncharacterized protein LOC142328997 isoform X2 n=1 Tax=Lycorma delicatula TaxID=130591 RepID=UPI003F50D538
MACHPQESLVSSTQDRTSCWLKTIDESRSVSDVSDRDSLINSHGSDRSSVIVSDDRDLYHSTFPWLTTFSNKCANLMEKKFDLPILHDLMTEFVLSLTADVNECYKKPNRAAKLKKVVNEYLLFFHMVYLDIKQPLEHLPYLNRMSDLLAMYVDLEIKASRRRKEHVKIICGKLTAALFVFLRYSMDHILDTMLKTRLMAKSSNEISAPVLGCVLHDKPIHPLSGITYVRYILVYKLWKKVVRGADERRRINKQACENVIPPDDFRKIARCTMLDGILPNIPKSRTDVTQFYMQAKFSVKDKAKAFLKVSQDPNVADDLVPNFSPDLDRFFIEDIVDSSRFNNSPVDEVKGSKSLLDELYSMMSNSASTDVMSDHVLGCSEDKIRQNSSVKKRKSSDVLSKKLSKKKLKNKEIKLSSCDSTKKNKNKKLNKLNKLSSSPFNKEKNKFNKEVNDAFNKLSKNINEDMLHRTSTLTVLDDNLDVIKKVGQNKLSDNKSIEKKNKLLPEVTGNEDDDNEEEEDDEADDEDDNKSTVSAITLKEEHQSPEKEITSGDLSFTNRLTLDEDRDKEDSKDEISKQDEASDVTVADRITSDKDKEDNEDEVSKKNEDSNLSFSNRLTLDENKENEVTNENTVAVAVDETENTNMVQSTEITGDNNVLLDKSEDTNDNEVSFCGFPVTTQNKKDTEDDAAGVTPLHQEENKSDLPLPIAQEVDESNVALADPSNLPNSLPMNDDSNSSDCIIEKVFEVPALTRSEISDATTSVIKTEDTESENFEIPLASTLTQDTYSIVYPTQTNELGGEEFLTDLMQQWTSQDEIYAYPSYELDVVEPCDNIIMVSNGEEDIISGSGDTFFGIYDDGVPSEDRERDSVPTRSSFGSSTDVRDGKITYSGKTQPNLDCSSSEEHSSTHMDVQTCVSDSEPHTPGNCESSPDTSNNTDNIPVTSPPASSPTTSKIIETQTSSLFVSLSRSDIELHQSSMKALSSDVANNNNNKKGVKRRAVSLKESEQPVRKQPQLQEDLTFNNSRETRVRKDKEDEPIKSIETASSSSCVDNNSAGNSSSNNNNSGSKGTSDSKESRSSLSTTSSRGNKSSSRRTRKNNDILEQRHSIQIQQLERLTDKEKEREILEKEMDKDLLIEEKKRSRCTKQTKNEAAISTTSSNSRSQKHKKKGTFNK